MQVQLLATGRMRDAHLRALEADYIKRLPAHWQFQVRELPESGEGQASKAQQLERGAQLTAWAAAPTPAMRVALDERGESLSSRALADKLQRWQNQGMKSLTLLIGGATGLHADVVQRSDWVWSLGPLTFPHQLVRLLVVEQLYRAQSINAGHPYHKA